MSILIKNAYNVDYVYISGNKIQSIGKKKNADVVINAKGKALLPGFVNTHTHAAMTLLRGYGEGLPLHDWLTKKIWPAEAKLTKKAVYWGTKLAILEMIKSGTTCFNDMYFFPEMAAKAAREMGMRAFVSYAMIDIQGPEKTEKEKKGAKRFLKEVRPKKRALVKPVLAPHAVYTVSEELFLWTREMMNKKKVLGHVHISETEKENRDCLKMHKKTPVQYLDSIGFLGKDVIAAHCCWLTPKDIKILAKRRVKVSHCPVSNMKLASGVLPYKKLRKAGVLIALGTDGTASNNCLDMFREMKAAALLQKVWNRDAMTMPTKEVFGMATVNGAKALGYNAGKIKEGMIADLITIDLKMPQMTPTHDLMANIVYSADGSCVSDVIIDGKIIMRNRRVRGEERIKERAEKEAEKLG
ncbi:MAG: amidohydrolase [Candidatus Diapherotrites archaeon]|nr:amidohydrolase [Candidatus Diapherotrites archaeon]